MRPIREYEGEIFTDYYFGEANTANKSDNYHNNAINENLNWGGFPGCYSSLPPTVDLVPRSRTVRWGSGEEQRETTKNSTPPTRDSTPCRRRTSDEKLPQRNDNVERRSHRDIKRRTTIQTDDQGKHSHSKW